MFAGPQLIRDRDAVLATIRAARFANGYACVRCGAGEVIRWGGFCGRRRYKCKSCRRTFSDLTNTPAYYSKHIEKWASYATCVYDGLTVRAAAAVIDVFPSTTFRWRHAILVQLRHVEQPVLRGNIEFLETRFRFSEKGARNISRAPHLRGVGADRLRFKQVTVVMARDPDDGVYSAICGQHLLRGEDLAAAFSNRVEHGSVVLCAQGPLSPFRRLAVLIAGEQRWIKRREEIEAQLARVRALIQSYRVWLERFNGVATKYKPNYLCWHRQVHRKCAATDFLAWPLL